MFDAPANSNLARFDIRAVKGLSSSCRASLKDRSSSNSLAIAPWAPNSRSRTPDRMRISPSLAFSVILQVCRPSFVYSSWSSLLVFPASIFLTVLRLTEPLSLTSSASRRLLAEYDLEYDLIRSLTEGAEAAEAAEAAPFLGLPRFRLVSGGAADSALSSGGISYSINSGSIR